MTHGAARRTSGRVPRRFAAQRGQNMVEMALILPLLLTLSLGIYDLGRAFGSDITATGSARSGLREGIQNNTNDVGLFIRGDSGLNTNWGAEDGPPFGGPDAMNAHCPTTAVGRCGDPNGCPESSFTATQDACFAVGSCRLAGATCNMATVTWNTSRPMKRNVLVIRVVTRFQLLTGLVAAITGRSIYMTHDQFAYPLPAP